MKSIIVASVTTLLLCSGSVAYAQYTPAQQNRAATPTTQPPAAAAAESTTPIDPRLDVSKMAPNQIEYLVTETLSLQPGVTPTILAKAKDVFAKSKPESQAAMAKGLAEQLEMAPAMKEKILKKMPAPKF